MARFSSLAAAAAVALCATVVNADASTVDTIIVKGKHFFYNTNHTEFFIRGVAYQQDYDANATASANADYTDPLADVDACNRDIPYLVRLRTNVIRTYAVNPENDHSGCMNALADAGIYVISDLSAPSLSINRNDPDWNVELYNRYTAVIQDLSQYNNVIGFFAGNEVSDSLNTTAASAFVKAAVRDSKAYIAANVDRPMYVGYATYDGDIRDQLAQYFNCGDQGSAIDFWGYNVYSWCGDSNYDDSNYDERTDFFRDYSVPAFFAEYGCIKPSPRIFTEVQALYGDQMTGVWSGGIVYMYFQEENGYGLATIDGDNVETNEDFDNLSSQMARISPSSTQFDDVDPSTLTPTSCPSVDASWQATPTPLPPRPNADLCNCVVDTLSCAVTSDFDIEGYGDIFGFICGENDGEYCDGIQRNATTGTYGAYGMCNPDVQLSYVMDRYFQGQNGDVSACDFDGAATTQEAASPSGTCQSLIEAAGTDGGGSVPTTVPPSDPTGSAGEPEDGGDGGSGDASGSDDGDNAASTVRLTFNNGMLYLMLYVVGAGLVGAGMIAL